MITQDPEVPTKAVGTVIVTLWANFISYLATCSF